MAVKKMKKHEDRNKKAALKHESYLRKLAVAYNLTNKKKDMP